MPPKEEDFAEKRVGILLLEDNEDDAHFILSELKKGGIEHVAKCVARREEFVAQLAEFRPDLILSDYKLPEFDQLEPLHIVRQNYPDIPFILVTGALGEELAVEIIKEGATDYILKDRLFRLAPAVERALREAEDRKRGREADEKLKKQHVQLQKQNEALRDSEERFRQLAENIREVFWMTDARKNQMIYISPGYESIWGRSCRSLYESPQGWSEAIYRDDRERVLKALVEKQISGRYDETYRIVRPDGTIRWIHDRAFPIRNEKGEVYRLTGIAEDITQRKATEAQLATLARAVESTAEMICITDMEDRFTFANAAFLRAYGYSQSEILGRKPDMLFSPENPPELLIEILKRTREGGWNGEVIDRRKDGTDFPISLGTSQIRDSDGHVIGLIGVARDITERKRAEERNAALSNLSHRMSAAATPSAAAEIIMDTASELIGWDAGYVDLYTAGGRKVAPVLTMDTLDGKRVAVEPPRSIVEPTALMQLVAAEGAKLVNLRSDIHMSDGLVPFGDTERRSESKMYVPIRSGREILGVLSIQSYTPKAYSIGDLRLLQTLADRCGDALQRIEMTEQLREAEAKYRGIFENAMEGIFQTTPDERFLSANPALAKMFGYNTPQELVSNVTDVMQQTYVQPDKRGELKESLEKQGMVKGFEVERYRKDGSRFWMSINGHVVRDAQGQTLYYEGIGQDITERKRAEAVLRESEEKFRTLFESAPIGMALHDAKGKYVQTNQAYQRMLGYDNEELRRLSVRRITHQDDVQEGQRLFEEFREGKRDRYQREKRYLHKDGHLVWAHASASALRSHKGELIYIISMVEDITERKELEQEVVETSANERRRVGHELHDGLGQYLAGIAFKAKALEQMLVAESVSHAAEAKELAALVSNAISQTRSLARGLDPIEVETIGLQAALQNLAVETQKFFNIACQFRCLENLVAIDPQVSLTLYRIVQEAIHNAITHGDAGNILIELKSNGSALCLGVHDDGSGFETDGARQGGIGLRVMQYRARAIGANLTITSKRQEGTQVQCVVPRPVGHPARPRTSPPKDVYPQTIQ